MAHGSSQTGWLRCSTCKKDLPFETMYYVCSVSTCKHPRKGFRFCSVDCWDAHLGFMNHREAWAEEAKAPTQFEYARSTAMDNEEGGGRAPQRTILPGALVSPGASVPKAAPHIATDTLVVVSKVKALIQDQSKFSVSQCAIDALTRIVVAESLKAIESARRAERKTVMGRDFTLKD